MVPSFNDVKMYFFDISEVFDGQVGTQIKEGKINPDFPLDDFDRIN